ncbi:hypothetical protein ABIF65_002178 [Bradyrhizobium japonicum]|nr:MULTISPECIES: hypothetical protein [Bradyrhizobium]MBR0879338.1 hypothetical protein [Bradyrhizobium liaoningense]MBR1004474.1 hypothetical protein [Bradyrhizobium liaoningense]MBR1069545.1 hypothetical protein [Bradyrhizobium liaoningense]MCP1740676.1 hypothetical protein [Bradyrhizobium japonicum]MCP1779030.1 hypothetical protein [Bradyrhizobium japonicum]
MTPDQKRELRELERRSRIYAERVQQIADVLANVDFLRALEVASPRNETAWMEDYRQTLGKLDEIAERQEALLSEVGIPK